MKNVAVLDVILNSDVATFRALIADGLEPNLVEAGQPLLHWAYSVGSYEIASLLIGAGADANSMGISGEAALMIASHSGNPAAVAELLNAGADVAYIDPEGHTALMFGARSGSCEVVRSLLGAGTPLNTTDAVGCNAAHWAMLDGDNSEVLQILIDAGVNIFVDSGSNRSVPAHWDYAVNFRREKCMLILERGKPGVCAPNQVAP